MRPGTETAAGIEELLREACVLPVVRSDTRSDALELVERVHSAGLDVVELTTTIPDWEELMHQVVNEHPDSLIGLGTVTRPEQARRALDLGARFLVSPFPRPRDSRSSEERRGGLRRGLLLTRPKSQQRQLMVWSSSSRLTSGAFAICAACWRYFPAQG